MSIPLKGKLRYYAYTCMSMAEMKIKYLICTIITTEPIKHKAQHDNMREGGLKVKIINQGASSLKSTSNNKT